MRCVAIIPARGGSKRVPGKNVKPFAGIPMIAHSIKAALAADLFDRVVVTTDSPEIADVSRMHGAEVPFMRPSELADDQTHIDAAVKHALAKLESEGTQIRYVCCLYATAPLIDAGDIRRGLEVLRETGATTAVAVAEFPYPVLRGLKINEDQRLEMLWPEHRYTHSSQLAAAYHDAAQFFWADVSRYHALNHYFERDAAAVIIPRYRVQDIDTPEDWATAERMYRALQHCDLSA